MLQARFNQSQELNLQYRKLVNSRAKHTKDQQVETERNGKDQQTETELNNQDKHTETDRSDSKDSQTSPFASRKNSLKENQDG